MLARTALRHRFMSAEGDPTIGSPGPSQAPTPSPAQPEVFSKEYVRELRAENSGWRLKHKEQNDAREAAEKKAQEAQTAAEAKVTEVTKAAEQRIVRSELKAYAVKAGIVDLDGLKLVDLSSVKLDENGEVVGAEALIESLKTAKPYLFGTPGSSSTRTPPSKDPPPAKSAKEMTKAEYEVAKKVITKR